MSKILLFHHTTSMEIVSDGDGRPMLTYRSGADQTPFELHAPSLEINGKLQTLAFASCEQVKPSRILSNGCQEFTVRGPVQGNPKLELDLQIRIAPDSPVVRFRFTLFASEIFRLTKTTRAGRDALQFTAIQLPVNTTVREVRLSDFNPLWHSYTLVEEIVSAGEFAAATPRNGPILTAESSGKALLLAYEHGAPAPLHFIEFALSPDHRVTLQAVRGSYYSGQEIGPGNPYQFPWLQCAGIAGDAVRVAATYRDFVRRRFSLSPATREPKIFYNTWAWQERSKAYAQVPYLENMRLKPILADIEIAAKLGVEVYVLDVGWFTATGDWDVQMERFPDELKLIKARLDKHGMKLGLWFGPTNVAIKSRIGESHPETRVMRDGKPDGPWDIWETPPAYNHCLVSNYGKLFGEQLAELSGKLGVTYFKWDAVNQMAEYPLSQCNAPCHHHGDAGVSAQERSDCFAYQMPLRMVAIAEQILATCPDAIIDFDATEDGRCVGLAWLAVGKYFLVNNGPYASDQDQPIASGAWNNLYVHPGPARPRIIRSTLDYDRWLPSTLFLAHVLPDDSGNSWPHNFATLILGSNGIWGELGKLCAPAIAERRADLDRYKQVRDAIATASLIRGGPVGGSPEIHEKIAEDGRGALVIFASAPGVYRHVTQRRVVSEFWVSAGGKVIHLPDGRAIFEIEFTKPNGVAWVFFGVEE